MSLRVSLGQVGRTLGYPLQVALALVALQAGAIAFFWIEYWPPIFVRPFFPRYDEDFFHAFPVYGIWISDGCFAAVFGAARSDFLEKPRFRRGICLRRTVAELRSVSATRVSVSFGFVSRG